VHTKFFATRYHNETKQHNTQNEYYKVRLCSTQNENYKNALCSPHLRITIWRTVVPSRRKYFLYSYSSKVALSVRVSKRKNHIRNPRNAKLNTYLGKICFRTRGIVFLGFASENNLPTRKKKNFSRYSRVIWKGPRWQHWYILEEMNRSVAAEVPFKYVNNYCVILFMLCVIFFS